MIAVIFEVEPKAGCRDAYLDLAAELKPLLAHRALPDGQNRYRAQTRE